MPPNANLYTTALMEVGGGGGDLPNNEDFRHLLIKLSCLLGINSPTVLAGKARSLLLLMKSVLGNDKFGHFKSINS